MPKRSSKLIFLSTQKNRQFLNWFLGVCLGLLGLMCATFSKTWVNNLIDDMMRLKPGTELVEKWRNPDINLTLDVYIFNWTNAEDFNNISVKPRLEQLGPYSFVEVPNKVIERWHPQNATLDYRKKHLYFFDPAASNGSLQDVVVSLNALLVTAASKTKYWTNVRRTIIDMALRVYSNGLTWKKTIDEFLFTGFKDSLLNLLAIVPSSMRSSVGLYIPFDRIGYAYGRNGSTEFSGKITIGTGADDIRRFGQIQQWNDRNSTDFFPNECSRVCGSPGEFQRTNLQKNRSIEYYFTDFCRSIVLDYVEEVEVKGVLGYRYKASPRTMDNGTLFPENKCYCNGDCVPSGVFNISSCWYGIPTFISFPHFYSADPYYGDQVDGLDASQHQRDLYVVLEPRTGLMLDLVGRLQLNIYIEPSAHLKSFQTERRFMFPVLWFDVRMQISSKSAKVLKYLPLCVMWGRIIGISIAVIGMCLLLLHVLRDLLNKRYLQHIEISDLETTEKVAPHKEVLLGSSANFATLFATQTHTHTHTHKSMQAMSANLDGDNSINSDLVEHSNNGS